MSLLDLRQHAHRRLNPLTGRWVLVSPQRMQRPWQGHVEAPAREVTSHYDPSCYMCPGNLRAQGQRNPEYSSTFVFENDFPALSPNSPSDQAFSDGLLVAQGAAGLCRVVCFSPRHDLTLARMDRAAIGRVVDCWVEELTTLRKMPGIAHIQIFENRGAMMGASNPHPHGQIWATSFVPDEVAIEQTMQRLYVDGHGTDLLGDYLTIEEQSTDRLVAGNGHFSVIVPFWAAWPFETLILPRRAIGTLEELEPLERSALADILHTVTRGYDRLFNAPFPYSLGFHLRPAITDRGFRMHLHVYPPLLRSAVVRKFMVGFELLGMPQRDLTPERAAELLRGTMQPPNDQA